MSAAMLLAANDALDAGIRAWGARLDWPAEYILRLVLAGVAGGLIGLEREVRGRQAGFRTNILVCVGSALVMLVSIAFPERDWPHDAHFNVNVDPARIAYGIMTGIGFLGAGTIIKHQASVRGLTTAAAMWCVAAIGMAAGFGMYTLTVVSTAIVFAALWFLDLIEDAIPKLHYRTIVVRRPWKPGVVADTVERVKSLKLRVTEANFERTLDLANVDISMVIAFTDKRVFHALQQQFEEDPQSQFLATRHE
jgi:putative Mg2+ transporter-C (MgtC) family protein